MEKTTTSGTIRNLQYCRSEMQGGRPAMEDAACVDEFVNAGVAFAGNPDTVFEQIREFNEHVGGLGHLLMMGQGGHISHEDTVGNLTLFSQEVLPRLAAL